MTTSTSKRRGSSRRSEATQLRRFLKANGLKSAQVEREVPISRQTMTRIKRGGDLRLSTMRRILSGVRRVAGRAVEMNEIFDLDPKDE
jgi:predicted transcriptional regulator